MKNKKFMFLVSAIILIILLIEIVSAITTVSPTTVYPGDTITLNIIPKKQGFYNIIYVMKNIDVVDLINVPCQEICRQKQTLSYLVPQTFLGEYYFATFDYATNNYELDYFNVLEPGGAPSGSLTIQEIKNTGSNLNFLINPEQGTYADIIITTELKIKNCQNYNVFAYLCEPSLYDACSSQTYTYKIQLNLASQSGTRCTYSYTGTDYFPFYKSGGIWKIIASSGSTSDQRDFTYSFLKAISYSSFINFGTLNARVWNTGVPSSGEQLVNFGNLALTLDWNSSKFSCISPGCTDEWLTFFQGENTFQIDDDNLFLETTETGLNPVFITDYSHNYFPLVLQVCTSDLCLEKLKTFFNLKIPDIQRGKYRGDINLTIN